MIGTTQAVIDWGRNYISDPKTRTKSIREEEIGRTSTPISQRETFYLKRPAIGSVFLYVEPYLYSATASLTTASSTDKVFMYNATLQSCTFPIDGVKSIRPAQFKPVLANYEYTESLPYAYSDTELAEFLPQSVGYLNNNYALSYTYTGTGTSFDMGTITENDKDIIARSLALLVRRSYVSEQMRRGLGVAFKGPMAAIDSKSQLNAFVKDTAQLENSIKVKIDQDKISGSNAGGQSVDIYSEDVVDS